MPLATPLPKSPMLSTAPLVMYSHRNSPVPSTTAVAPEFRTAKRSPAWPWTNSRPPEAPKSAKLPMRTLPPGSLEPPPGERTVMVPPHALLPTPSLQVPVCVSTIPSLQKTP
ncbi:Uncharacterised protein [Mycobacteroides abscessus]|nr:Uncharacterised protein [Mycobacteroides abscessus]